MIGYKKGLAVILLAGGGAVLVGLIVCNYNRRYQEPKPREQRTTGKVIFKNEISIQNPERALRAGAVDFGEEFLTCMTDEYTKDTPLVELLFNQRGGNGQVKPFKVWTVNIKRADGFPVGGFSLEGRNKLRMGVGETQEPRLKSRWTLLRGRQYYVDKYSPAEGGRLIRGLRPQFTVPRDLQGNQVYRVELILRDEILEQEQLEAEEALARQRREQAEREKITIHIREYPEPNSRLIGFYYDGKKLRQFHDEEGIMTLMGPNKLAGDLMVGVAPRGHMISMLRPWIYIKDLQKRELIAPDDAERVISKNELIDVQILLEVGEDELAKSLRKIFFCPYQQGKVPLFCVLVQQEMRTDSGYAIKMPMLPGTYYPKAFIYNRNQNVKKWIPLGRLEITNQAGKAYIIKVPVQREVVALQR